MSSVVQWLDEQSVDFPDPATALDFPNGLLAAGGDLEPGRLLNAYRHGIFPWFEDGQPVLWWSPDPRMVLFPGELHISRSMHKFLRRHPYDIRSDTDFASVIRGCAEYRPNSSGTWITDEMEQAYIGLHEKGIAHSVEIWDGRTLVGGLYGLAMGRVFFGESMFSLRPNVSKLALIDMTRRLAQAGYRLVDCQVASAHLESLGARPIRRSEFMRFLPGDADIGRTAEWPYNTTT